jgi:hypothetical protein
MAFMKARTAIVQVTAFYWHEVASIVGVLLPDGVGFPGTWPHAHVSRF